MFWGLNVYYCLDQILCLNLPVSLFRYIRKQQESCPPSNMPSDDQKVPECLRYLFLQRTATAPREGTEYFCSSVKFLLISTVCPEIPRHCQGYSLANVGMIVHLSPKLLMCPSVAQLWQPQVYPKGSKDPCWSWLSADFQAPAQQQNPRNHTAFCLNPKVCLLLKLLPFGLGVVVSLSNLEKYTQFWMKLLWFHWLYFCYLIMLVEWVRKNMGWGSMETVNQKD